MSTGAGSVASPPRAGTGGLSRWPLSVTLVVTLALLAAVGLLVAGVAATAFLRGYLVQQVDDQIAQVAHQFSDVPNVGDPGGPTGPTGPGGSRGRQAPSAFYVAFAAADGTQVGVIANPFDSSSPPALPALTTAQVLATSAQPFTVDSKDGATPWRVVAEPASSSGPGGSTTQVASVQVAQSLAPIEATVRRLAAVEIAVGAIVLLLLGFAAWWLVRRSLRPLGEVEETAEAIAAGDLSRRVPEGDPRTEVGRLSVALNGMLGQIQTGFSRAQQSEAAARDSEARMRRFVGDASHELRTPLTSIRGFSELYRQGALTDEADVARAMGRIEGEASRMGLLVDDLLALARMDQQRALAREPVDLLVICGDAVHDARAVAPDREVSLEVLPGSAAPVVVGDEPSLRQVLANLLSNALRYSPEGSPVVVRVGTAGDRAVLEVADRGPGLDEETAARVFERFYRADSARHHDSGGTGLGLAIVDTVARAHGGAVEVDTSPGEGATFRVLLPLA